MDQGLSMTLMCATVDYFSVKKKKTCCQKTIDDSVKINTNFIRQHSILAAMLEKFEVNCYYFILFPALCRL